jgi:predicted ATP-dependent serine protease
MEEFYRNRTERNKKQIMHLTEKYQLDPSWSENVYVVDETFPRYLFSDNDWAKLEAEIFRVKPSVVMLDSLTRMTVDPIEDSTVASKVMRKLRELAFKYSITMIIIHHSQKIENKALTIASLAGSRVIGQELDFMIGINRTSNNVRYLKDVAYRYAPDDSEHVMIFNSNESQIVEKISLGEEAAIIAGSTTPAHTFNKDELVLDFILEHTNQDAAVIFESSLLVQNLVDTRKMVKPTLYAALKRLLESKIIEKIGKGQFKLVGPSST